MTLLPSSPTVRGFTANNLRGSVRYRRRPPAAARAPDRTRLRGNGLLDGSLGGRLGVRGGSRGGACNSRRARRLARRLARVSLWRMVRGGPGVLPDGSLAALRRRIRFETGPASYPTARSWRFGGWFEAGPASCPTARSRRFGGWFEAGPAACLTARSCVASAGGSIETSPASCPAARSRRFGGCQTARATTASRVR